VELLPGTSRHVVIYAYMGLYPRTAEGARSLLAKAVELAVSTGSARLIVKTIAESHRIPTIEENVAALEYADAVARTIPPDTANALADGQIYREAYALVDTVLNCAPDVGQALVVAFRRGLLDVPYCVHPDNAGRARSYIDTDGTLRWSELGALPLRGIAENHRSRPLTSTNLMEALSFVQTTFDAGALEGSTARPLGESGRVATRWERTLGGELG
jgi:methylaspartate mutase epsilon subunit